MSKTILYIATSLDGHIAREDGRIDWLPENDVSGYEEFYKTVDIIVMGKTTFEQVLTFEEYPYKDKKSYVFTKNNNSNNYTKNKNIVFVSNVEKFIKDVLSNTDKNVWLIGGGQIISSFFNCHAIDEIILFVVPIVLGKGIPLFSNIQKETKLELIETINHNNLIELHYRILK